MFIRVVEHDPAWEGMFKEEFKKIRAMVGDNWVNTFHIGSTSVPGLKAKPVIDMLLVVKDLEALDALAPQFEALGYEVMGEYGIPERRFYRKGGEERTHHIHAFQKSNVREIKRHVAFRDYLCEHPDVAQEYGELKSQLAEQFPNDIDGYCDGKDEFVKRVEKIAYEWHWTNKIK